MLSSAYALVDITGERWPKITEIVEKIWNFKESLSEKALNRLDELYHPISFSAMPKQDLWTLVDFELEKEVSSSFKLIFPTSTSDSNFKDLYMQNKNFLHIIWQQNTFSISQLLQHLNHLSSL